MNILIFGATGQPMHKVQSKTAAYRVAYVLATPLFGIIRTFWPRSIVTSEQVGLAMLGVARRGYPRAVLEVPDIQKAAENVPAGTSVGG